MAVLYMNLEKKRLDDGFLAQFGQMPTHYYSAPGRTEIGGNYTDHQRGRVLAAPPCEKQESRRTGNKYRGKREQILAG